MKLKSKDEERLGKLVEGVIRSDAGPQRVPESEERLLRQLEVLQKELETQYRALQNAEAELSDVRERHRDLYDKAPVAYVDLDASSKILATNPLSQELLGAKAVGSYLRQYLASAEASAFERYRLEVAGSPDRFVGEFRVVDATGRLRELRLDSIRTKVDGSEWRAALIDVTAQNVALRRADHVERLELVGEHASGVAHDLNNLLYGIAVHANLALQFVRDGLPVYDSIVQILDALKQCTSVTEQLTCFSRAEAEASSILDLNDVLARREAFMASLLGDNIELELDVAASDPSIRMVEAHAEQILLSVLRNSRYAMPNGGRLRVATATVLLAGCAGDAVSERRVRWTMADTGGGMSDDTRQRAFEPFFTTKPAASGTGLGLALVKAIVERAGGSVLLESELGQGTILIIDLPCASALSRRSSRPPPPGPA